MDPRIEKRLVDESGLPLAAFPARRVIIQESAKRTDEPNNRLVVQRISKRDGVLITAIPRVVAAIRPVLQSMTTWEIFSPLGINELRRALGPRDAESLPQTYGFDYVLTNQKDFRPVRTGHVAVPLRKKDIPPEQFDLRMSERRKPIPEDFIWAFACYHNDPDATPTELGPFGPLCASIAVVIWKAGPDIASYGVGTEEAYRGQGYGLAAVSAATKWMLEQGAVAWYGAYASNVPSLRLARKLGFKLIQQTIGA